MEDEGLSNMMGIEEFGKQKKPKQSSAPAFDDARPLSVSLAQIALLAKTEMAG
jgi:WD repeat-containing protein 70